MTPESRTLTQTIHAMAPIGLALVDCATHLAGMAELMPKRGELNLEFHELVTIIARIEERYRDADEALLAAVTKLEHDKLVPHPQPLREITHGLSHATQSDRMDHPIGRANARHTPTLYGA